MSGNIDGVSVRQVWLCGGSMEVLPCSRVAHIARMKKPYHSNIAFHTRRNALRVAEVWMDEYKSNVYLAWNIPMEVRELGCHSNRVEATGSVHLLSTYITAAMDSTGSQKRKVWKLLFHVSRLGCS